MADPLHDSWNVLVVDDEEDVHAVTELALKRQQWHGRSFSITRADSARQAKVILAERPPSTFHVAVVDVVMETDSAGLELCDYIRSKLPLSLRIILRTGQAGIAPEERVVEEFEIDHYLAKVDATADRMRSLIVASLRSSIDVRMLLALREQLESFAGALQATLSADQFDKALATSLSVVGWKYRANTFFYPNLGTSNTVLTPDGQVAADMAIGADRLAGLLALHKAGVAPRTFYKGSRFGVSSEGALLWLDTLAGVSSANDGGLWSRMKRVIGAGTPEGPKPYGLVIEPERELGPKARETLERDISPFLDNWVMAQRLLSLQEGAVRVPVPQTIVGP